MAQVARRATIIRVGRGVHWSSRFWHPNCNVVLRDNHEHASLGFFLRWRRVAPA